MKIVCSKCKKEMGEKPDEVNNGEVSHSICETCDGEYQEELAEIKERIRKKTGEKKVENSFPIK